MHWVEQAILLAVETVDGQFGIDFGERFTQIEGGVMFVVVKALDGSLGRKVGGGEAGMSPVKPTAFAPVCRDSSD